MIDPAHQVLQGVALEVLPPRGAEQGSSSTSVVLTVVKHGPKDWALDPER